MPKRGNRLRSIRTDAYDIETISRYKYTILKGDKSYATFKPKMFGGITVITRKAGKYLFGGLNIRRK